MFLREWRNWQTRTFEGRVDFSVRVQVPFLAPTKAGTQKGACFCLCKLRDAEPLPSAERLCGKSPAPPRKQI